MFLNQLTGYTSTCIFSCESRKILTIDNNGSTNVVARRNKYKEKQTHCDTQCNFKCIKTIDHQGILKLKKKKTVLCEKHKTSSAILRHIESPCQTFDFFQIHILHAFCLYSNQRNVRIVFKTNMIRALFEGNTQRWT